MKKGSQPQHTQGELKAYPEGHKHTEEYPEPKANPYRVDIAVDGFAQMDGSGLVAKVYGKTAEQAEANAHRIVKAVNMHDELIEAMKTLIDSAKGNNEYECDANLQDATEKAEQLLKQAEGK